MVIIKEKNKKLPQFESRVDYYIIIGGLITFKLDIFDISLSFSQVQKAIFPGQITI